MDRINRRAFTGLALAAAAVGRAQAAAPDRVIPLRMDDNRLTVPVTINGGGPYRFLVSTASQFAIIDSNLARGFGLRGSAIPPVDLITTRGGIAEELFKAKSLKVGGVWDLKDLELLGRPFPAGSDIQGIFPFVSLGMSTFDFETPELRVHMARVTPPAGATKAFLVQWSGRVREPPIVRVDLGGHTLRLLLDTGSDEAVYLYPDAVKRMGLWDRYPKSFTRRHIDTERRGYATRTVRGETLTFAGRTFERPVIRMMDPALAGKDKVNDDGIAGMDLLRRFRITFDPVKQSVWFSPNSRIYDDYSYDRAGIDTEGEDGGVRVTQVDPGSPAEKAGVRLDDLIVGVAGQSQVVNIPALLSGAPGQAVLLRIERKGVRVEAPLVLEERL